MQGSEEKLVRTAMGEHEVRLPGKAAVLGVSLKTSLPWRNLQ